MQEKEIWKDIPNYDGDYQVSNLGRVRSFKGIKERFLKPSPNGRGYLHVVLHKKRKQTTSKVHQMVAVTFLNHNILDKKMVVDHIDNNKLNNTVNNLQLISQRENVSKESVNKTGFLGVFLSGRKNKPFMSQISINGKIKHLGRFETKALAAKAYQDKLKEITNK